MKPIESMRRFSFTSLEDIRLANNGIFPGFLFLRHFLSVVILAHHARIALRGFREGSLSVEGALQAGQPFSSFLFSAEAFRPFLYALVGAFFALSGFLVTGSALRTGNVRTFLIFRALRIFPALASEITLSALFLGVAVTVVPMSVYFSSPELYSYFLNVLGFAHYTLPGVFETNPIPLLVNANLWTLGPEFYCYLIMAFVMASGLAYRRGQLLFCVAVVTLTVAVLQVTHMVDLPTRWDSTRFTRWMIVYMFFLGVILALYADCIPRNFALFVVCGCGYVVLMWTFAADLLASVLLAYCTIYVGSLDLRWFDRALRSDYSYGLYLYGYPITQTLVFFALPAGILKQDAISTVMLIVVSLALTLGFSAVSWKLIESPALKLRGIFISKRKPS